MKKTSCLTNHCGSLLQVFALIAGVFILFFDTQVCYGGFMAPMFRRNKLISTLAGVPFVSARCDATGTTAGFNSPYGIAFDSSGNMYVADTNNHQIRKVSSAGVVTTLAGAGTSGYADGNGTAAYFNSPTGIAVDTSGNVFVADSSNNMIRKITSAGVVTTFAGNVASGYTDGSALNARFSYPAGMTIDSSGNLFVADSMNCIIRKITSSGTVSTLAGQLTCGFADATGTAAQFNNPSDVVVDGTGNVFVVDSYNFLVRKITPVGQVTTFAGGNLAGVDGTGTSAGFWNPWAIKKDASNNLYVVDGYSIRKITTGKVVTTLAGSVFSSGILNGTGSAARFLELIAIGVDGSGNIFVADQNMIRKVTSAGVVTDFVGTSSFGGTDLSADAARYSGPTGIAVDSSGNIYIADRTNSTIRKMTSSGVVTTFVGVAGWPGDLTGTGVNARLVDPWGIATDSSGNIYVSDSSMALIRKITAAGVMTNLAGSGSPGSANGTGASASFNYPAGLAVDSSGNIFVADSANNMIRKITSGGTVSTFAGSTTAGSNDGTGTSAKFQGPYGVAVDSSGNVFVADTNNCTIRKITSGGVVSTLAGTAGSCGNTDATGSAARFTAPYSVTVDSSGNLYVADYGAIRKVTSGGVVTTLAGSTSGILGFANGNGTAVLFNQASGIALDSSGNMLVADKANNMIRKLTSSGDVTTYSGTLDDGSTDSAPTGYTPNFNSLGPLTRDSAGNFYLADIRVIRKLNTSGVITNFAGSNAIGKNNGTGSDAGFFSLTDFAINSSDVIYVADAGNHKIRKITSAGVVTDLAGSGTAGSANGTGAGASFSSPEGVVVDSVGDIYVADTNNQMIRKVTAAGVVTTVAGTGVIGSLDGTTSTATFYQPKDIVVDSSGNIYVADQMNSKIRKISGSTVSTIATNITVDKMVIDSANNIFAINTNPSYFSIKKITPAGVVRTVIGNKTLNSSLSCNSTQRFATGLLPKINGIMVDDKYLYLTTNRGILKIPKP